MAEDDMINMALGGLNMDGSGFASAGNVLAWIAIAVLVAILLTFLFMTIVKLKKFRHYVVLKNRTSGVPVVVRDKARIDYDADGTEKSWRLLRLKTNIPVPPHQAREQTDNGSFFVRGEIHPEKGILFIHVKGKKKGELVEGDINFENIADQKGKDTGERFTQNSKIFFTNQLERAKQEAAGLTKLEVLNKAIMPMFFILMFLIGLIFLPSVIESYGEALEAHTELVKELGEVAGKVDAIYQCSGTIPQENIEQPEDPRPD